MKQFITNKNWITFLFLTAAFSGCASRKNTTSSQNFSVRYNFLFNANELLAEYERDTSPNPQEDFAGILPVFISHPPKPALMDKVIKKAGTIIAEKGNSNYVALAYLLKAKAYFNNEDYFSAIGYANDILNDYSNEIEVNDEALLLKTRALFAIEDYEAAYPLAIELSSKAPQMNRNKSRAYAAAAQGCIFNTEWTRALTYLKSALQHSSSAEEKIRIRYVSAQLLEKVHQSFEALEMYKTIKKSNASYELKLNAALKVIELDPSSYSLEETVPKPLKRMLKNDVYQDYKDQILYALASYENKAGRFPAATAHYLEAAKLNGTNKMLTSKAYAQAADIQLKKLAAYPESSLNYQAAITALPKSSTNYTATRNKLKFSAEVSNIYTTLAKIDTIRNAVETPAYNQQIIDSYYEIATLYLQRVQDSVQAEKVYTQINSRFPHSSVYKSVNYALSLLRSRSRYNQQNNVLAGNAFLLKHHQDEFTASMENVSNMNRDRNLKLIRAASLYDQPNFQPDTPPTETARSLAATQDINPIAFKTINDSQTLNLVKTPLTYSKELAAEILTTEPTPPIPFKTTPVITFSKDSQSAIYYFIISVEDASLNMSPSRFGVGEFNRSRYTESNLKHRLLEFEQTQVIYVGVFTSVDDARKYAAEITPQLKTIMKTGGKKYSTAIISKENLEKLESDEIYKVYQDFSKS